MKSLGSSPSAEAVAWSLASSSSSDFIARGNSHVQSEVKTRSPSFFLAFPEAFELRPGSFPQPPIHTIVLREFIEDHGGDRPPAPFHFRVKRIQVEHGEFRLAGIFIRGRVDHHSGGMKLHTILEIPCGFDVPEKASHRWPGLW